MIFPPWTKHWDHSVCAVMMEPIQGEGGIQVPDQDYLKEVKNAVRSVRPY